MGRIHLFEFGDQRWVPGFLRDYLTDFLQFGANAFDAYKDIVPVIIRALEHSTTYFIYDLASGGGGGLIKLSRHLKEEIPQIKIILSDLFPNKKAFSRIKEKFPHTFDFEKEPIDAKDVPYRFLGMRTMFLSFHHFKPKQAKEIIKDAVDQNMPIGIFEVQQRNPISLILMILSPVNLLLTTPFIKPFRFGRLIFTYLIPILPIMVLWDGVVSVLRTYSRRELNEMIDEIEGTEKFIWEIDITKKGPAGVLYMVGYPKETQE